MVELSTSLKSFEQFDDYVMAHIVKTIDGKEVEETMKVQYLVGSDGGRSIVRKLSGITFLGESRVTENFVVGDIHVKRGLSGYVSLQL